MIATAQTVPPVRLPVVPLPRRLPVTLAVIGSAGVFATSLRALPPGLLLPLAAAWFGAFAAGALAPRSGPVILTALAGLTRAATVALIVWAVMNPHSPLGPHTILAWVPIGPLEAGTGLHLLAVIRHRAR